MTIRPVVNTGAEAMHESLAACGHFGFLELKIARLPALVAARAARRARRCDVGSRIAMFLLDTHVLVWMLAEPARLGPDARAAIESAHSEEAPCVSAISFWEVARPEGKGRIELGSSPLGWRRQLLDQGLEEIPATGAIGVSAAELRGFHGDPRPTD